MFASATLDSDEGKYIYLMNVSHFVSFFFSLSLLLPSLGREADVVCVMEVELPGDEC